MIPWVSRVSKGMHCNILQCLGLLLGSSQWQCHACQYLLFIASSRKYKVNTATLIQTAYIMMFSCLDFGYQSSGMFVVCFSLLPENEGSFSVFSSWQLLLKSLFLDTFFLKHHFSTSVWLLTNICSKEALSARKIFCHIRFEGGINHEWSFPVDVEFMK